MPDLIVGALRPFEEEDWFFGVITRDEATELLLNGNNQTGAFLVRESTYNSSQLALSVRTDSDSGKEVTHFRIEKITAQNGQQVRYTIGEQEFMQLSELVAYHRANKLNEAVPLIAAALRPERVPSEPSDMNTSSSRRHARLKKCSPM